jgi:uncharacterized DUF497 family protein
MEVEWDETKRLANLAKHGLAFIDVAKLDWRNALILEDRRKPYPEPRYWTFATREGRLHMVAFCVRGARFESSASARPVGRR